MNENIILKAAAQFGTGIPMPEPIGDGLIHQTYKVNFTGNGGPVVLQCINQRTFPQPENIIHNYRVVYNYLQTQPGAVKIPALVTTHHNKYFWIDEEDNFWRASIFIPDSHSLAVPSNESDAYRAARCFAELTRSLAGLDTDQLNIIIPDFHNLRSRYHQFEEAIAKAGIMRLLRSTHIISELRQRKKLVDFYGSVENENDYPTRVMHHDCKISNILFDKATNAVLCPVDLDTVMPGKFFSDIGDMIRSMACPVDENSTAWEKITILGDYYQAIITGYLDGMGNLLTEKEKSSLHYSGLVMIYMQSLRFVTDFLNNDIYYQTSYPEQNLNRALNQFILLEQLEEFLSLTYGFKGAGC
jgi:hypothetical protein